VLVQLAELGVLDFGAGGRVEPKADAPGRAALVEAATAARERRSRVAVSRLEMMRGYAETRSCRRRFLLTYFGERVEADCGHCDNCIAGVTVDAGRSAAVAGPFAEGRRVRHADWGNGRLIRVEEGRLTALFDEGGYRTLDADIVAERGLLEVVD
jgi:ATP-dependent DNA helicase RecQ